MAVGYYDEALYNKLKNWIPDNLGAHILKPDETARLFRLQDDKKKDEPLTLPLIALSRDTNIELLDTTKNPLSFEGKKVGGNEEKSILVNAIPISVFYQIDIFTKHYDESNIILRELIFKLFNNPRLTVTIPYNGINLEYVAYTRIGSTITDNSDIPERQIEGEFTRWTIQLEIKDAYLFSVPFKQNWSIDKSDGLIVINTKSQINIDEEKSHNGFTHISEVD